MDQYQEYANYASMGMAAYIALGIIVKATPTPKDDKWYSKLAKIIRIFGLSPENYKDKWGL